MSELRGSSMSMMPLGKTFGKSDTYQIVGICSDAHYTRVRGQVLQTFYRLFTQSIIVAISEVGTTWPCL
jgi:hypothetical protein